MPVHFLFQSKIQINAPNSHLGRNAALLKLRVYGEGEFKSEAF